MRGTGQTVCSYVSFKDFLSGASISLVLLAVTTFELKISSVDVEDQSAMHLLAAADPAVLSRNGITGARASKSGLVGYLL